MSVKNFVFLFLCGVFGSALGDNSYALYVPKIIRPGFSIQPAVSILNSANPVQVTVHLTSSDNVVNLQNQAVINSGSSATINVGQVPRGYAGSHKFTLNVTGVNSVTGDTLFTNQTSGFTFAAKTLSIFIQTDKAIYKPGQTIKFRAVVLKPDLRPLIGNVSYSVKDPKGNTILLETDVVLDHGVAGNEFPLNKDALGGNWKITYKTLGYKEEMNVEVKLYKLPKFKVEIEAPTYIYKGSPSLTVTLKGTYTYGKPVKGKASLSMKLLYSYGGPVFFHSRGFFGNSAPQGNFNELFKDFDGEGKVELSLDAVKKQLGWDGESERKISITGSVTDGQSKVTINETIEIDAKKTNIKIDPLYKPNTIKPGLFYTAYIKVSEPDGKQLMESDRTTNALMISSEFTSRSTRARNETVTEHAIPPDGVVVFTLSAPETDFSSVQFKAYMRGTNRWEGQNWSVDRAESPSNSYLQITTSESTTVSPGEVATVTIRTTSEVSSVRIMSLSRGSVLQDETITGTPVKSRDYSFDVTHAMIPGVQLLVSYVRADGEIVADYIKLTVSTSLENQVTVTSSATRVDAGTDVSIKVQTSGPGSYVGARAIDQSVLLLKSGNDISQERVVTDLSKYETEEQPDYWRWWWWYPVPSGAKDTSEVFSEMGMLVLTDALVYKKQPDYFDWDIHVGVDYYDEDIPVFIDYNAESSGGVMRESTSEVKIRSSFPETWVWTEALAGADGSTYFNTTAPDTITSWILSVFSVSDQYGLGLADSFKITVFRQFFVSLNLPLKVTRGEIIIVQAIIFNYFKTDLAVEVTLSDSGNFELIRPGDDPLAAGPFRIIDVPADGAVSVKFPLRMLALGEVPITVSAVSELAGDALTRTVYVRPEGVQECYSTSVLINRASRSEPTTAEDMEIQIPANIVQGSEKVQLSIYGDILGNTLKNLGNLLRKPSGCGEQNMLGFAPDVFVTLYLHKADQLDTETRRKAYDHFHSGYTNELNYKHSDGSYSAFGDSDPSGSTWLTAFVIKCFLYARELQPNLVQEEIVTTGLDFLVNQQDSNGHFNEPGKVSHKDMQGGVNSPITMTAYVLVTLRETNFAYRIRSVQQAADRARTYLESNLNSIKQDKYALAIVTYALHVAESDRANEALQALELLATIEGGMKFWAERDREISMYKESWRPPYYKPSTNDVEMTAYALLTYVRRGNVGASAPIMKWLSSKQNPHGGYSSTQDTVIAIQAMSNVAGLLVGTLEELSITATHSSDPTFSADVTITPANSMVFNQINVSPIDGDVQVRADGVGVGVVQLSVCYNLPEGPFQGESFECTADVSDASSKSARVDFCCQLKQGSNETTGMFLMEQKLANGFTVDLDAERERNRDAKLVELDDDSVNVYYDDLSPGQRRCANVELLRYADVAKSKPQPLTASDYYKPDRQVSKLLEVPQFAASDACTLCGSECVGCPGFRASLIPHNPTAIIDINSITPHPINTLSAYWSSQFRDFRCETSALKRNRFICPRISDWGPWSVCKGFCDSELSVRVKYCIDPNNNETLDYSQCPTGEVVRETRPCAREGFPCPAVSDGLWYKLPRGAGYTSRRNCTLKRSWSGVTRSVSIPGSIINQDPRYSNNNNNFFTCSNPTFDRGINESNGFTVSFLVRLTELSNNVPMVLVSYGKKTKTVFKFEKVWWKNEFRFVMNHGVILYRVQRITPSQLPLNQWNHVVLTWDWGVGARVYIDGTKVGYSSKYALRRPVNIPTNAKLTIGASDYGNAFKRGYVKGGFSAFNFWQRVLTSDEVGSLASFYRPLVGPNNPDPEISVRQLHHFAPAENRNCFKTTWTFSELYLSTDPCSSIRQRFQLPPPPPPSI